MIVAATNMSLRWLLARCWVCSAVLVGLTVTSVGFAEPAKLKSQTYWLGDIEYLDLNESSGLANSNYDDEVLWSINDSGDGPNLYALSTSGEHIGVWSLAIAKPSDWEAITSFVLNGTRYLMIGDVGDNYAQRDRVSVTVIIEPDPSQPANASITPVWQQEFRYANGAMDCESIAVDTQAKQILLLSKRRIPHELYRLPLSFEPKMKASSQPEIATASLLGRLSLAAPLKGLEAEQYGTAAPYMHMPTDMTLRDDRLLVMTMKNAFVFSLQSILQQAAAGVATSQPADGIVELPYLGQREAVTFARNRADLAYISKERLFGNQVAGIYAIEFKQ